MSEQDTKKEIFKIGAIVLGLSIVILSVTYAFINIQLEGTKKQVITAGVLDLELDEDENNLTITDALPMYDDVGMIQEPFTFRLINNSMVDVDYILKIQQINTTNLNPSDVKYGFEKDGVRKIDLVSNIKNNTLDAGTIEKGDTIEYSLRLWIKDEVTDIAQIKNKMMSLRFNLEATQKVESTNPTVTFAGITKEVFESPEGMFNYTSEGKYFDYSTYEEISDSNYVTSGLYKLEEDGETSYFFRGEVDNLVQFGEYEEDYYVYRYNGKDYVTLEACMNYDYRCTESNKVKKYDAGTPMYWRIIRINDDGTIRMIYTGTSPDATLEDTGIGVSYYNNASDSDIKYTGYSYDRTTNEIDSAAKDGVDTWYSSTLEGSEYDSYIATGEFCSDSSVYGMATDFDGSYFDIFWPAKRLQPKEYSLGDTITPTFKCPVTTETYGGSYNLKAGLITADEIVAAGGGSSDNSSYYLYNGTEFFSMTPEGFSFSEEAYVYGVSQTGSFSSFVASTFEFFGLKQAAILRPVINLRSDVVFDSATDGSKLTPYRISQ